MRWRWQNDLAPGDPWTNMAVDSALFDALLTGESYLPTVRVYRWDRAAVSFGRLQSEEQVAQAFPGLPRVRRPTGGLAVLHQGGLTLSVVTRAEWLPSAKERGVLSSYRQIVTGLINALWKIGILADLGQSASPRSVRPIDCFAETARCDIADQLTGQKVVGCAQRRDQGIILQQMQVVADIITDELLFFDYLKDCWKETLAIEEWICVDSPRCL